MFPLILGVVVPAGEMYASALGDIHTFGPTFKAETSNPVPCCAVFTVAPAGEMYASALGDIYTFGPTFRAENSNTSRHLAEFWMIEPELAFADLADDMACAEAYLKHCVNYIMEVGAGLVAVAGEGFDFEGAHAAAGGGAGKAVFTRAVLLSQDRL